MKPSVTIFIPAYNEEQNIADAVAAASAEVKNIGVPYELLIIDDGSTDKTGDVVKALAKKNSHIRFFENEVNLGLGESFKEAIREAKCDYITGFPGDNDMSAVSMGDLIREMGTADLISAYPTDPRKRSLMRRFISRSFVIFMNTIFWLNLRYYNGPCICRVSLVRKVPLKSKGLTVFAEMRVRMLKSGATLKEITFEHIGRKGGESKALSTKNILATFSAIFSLIRDIYLR